MNAQILKRLNRINQQFYQEFSVSFSRTRQRLQPGVSAVLANLPENGNWLDIGCGNGNLADAWVKSGRTGYFCGLDFSPGFIADAEDNVRPQNQQQEVFFSQVDLTQDDWVSALPGKRWDGIFCFAVLHHIPGEHQRELLCKILRGLLVDGKECIVSVWQPTNSPRLTRRILAWENIGISTDAVDPGDVLMDWRAQVKDEDGEIAYRYVHVFKEDELTDLAKKSGFLVDQTFYSDGKEGNLGLYQRWAVNF